jgi:hypothetical protein
MTVHDVTHGFVPSNVTVVGTWGSGPAVSCVTSNGQCSVSTLVTSRKASVTFTITGLTDAYFVYDQPADHNGDGDSTGTAIVVRKP